MIDTAAEILDWSSAYWWHWFAVFLRVAAITSLIPVFGEQNLPMRIRLGAAVALSTVVAPAIPGEERLFSDVASSLAIIFVEIANGVIFGLGLRLMVVALQTAGAIAAQSTSLSQLLGNSGTEPMPAIGHVLVMGGLALAVTLGLHIHAVKFIINSYQLLPQNTFPGPDLVSKWGMRQVAHSFAFSFQLAAPFVIASVLYNLTLGVINRAMPQLMVAFVGAPVITAAGLILLMLSAPVLLSVWYEALTSLMTEPGMYGR